MHSKNVKQALPSLVAPSKKGRGYVSHMYRSEGSAPAAGPSGNQLTADLQIRRISRISKICRIESIGKFSN